MLALTGSSGTPSAAYVYDSFGNLVASAGNALNPFRYTAREFDTETGLYYYRARYYDPSLGRFVSEDSSRFATGSPNFYAYVENSPANYDDPTGHLKREGDFRCCDARNVDLGISELQRVLNAADVMGRPVFNKYRECLREKAFPGETVRCAGKVEGCGSFFVGRPDVIKITALGSLGRKGSCGPVASTLLHELVHDCYFRDTNAPGLSRLNQQKEANCAECELFGWNCYYCRHPQLAPLD